MMNKTNDNVRECKRSAVVAQLLLQWFPMGRTPFKSVPCRGDLDPLLIHAGLANVTNRHTDRLIHTQAYRPRYSMYIAMARYRHLLLRCGLIIILYINAKYNGWIVPMAVTTAKVHQVFVKNAVSAPDNCQPSRQTN